MQIARPIVAQSASTFASTGGEVRLDRLAGVYWSRQTVSARRP
ncbi:hypothetical protein ACSFA8_10485 [Variovorax sp. RT4R15]